jgi:hypothetical protein
MRSHGLWTLLVQAGSHSNALEFNLQAGKTMLEEDVRTSFVPVGHRSAVMYLCK